MRNVALKMGMFCILAQVHLEFLSSLIIINFFVFNDILLYCGQTSLSTQKFLYYAMQDPRVYSQAVKKATGTAQKTVGLSVLRELRIPFIEAIEVQKKIVSKIEAHIFVCDSIEKTVDTALQQAEALRQSVLKKAFEGGL